MINMDDVAQKAGVSKSTVSRVLNAKKLVSSDAREKVFAACKDLDYRMNHNIQDFVLKGRNGSTRNIAFVLVGIDFADPAYAKIIDGISAVINEAHYHLMLVKLTGKEESIYDLPPVLRDDRVDGILISGRLSPNVIAAVKKLEAKCVVIGNYSAGLLGSLSSVQANLALNSFEAVEKLVKQDKKQIAFVEENPENYSGKLIFEGYKQALNSFGLVFNNDICYFGHGPFSGIFNLMKPVFKQNELPFDSIICSDIRIAREISSLLIGRFWMAQDIPVTIATFRQYTYNNELPVPTIYIDLNIEKRVNEAFLLLVDQIDGKRNSQTIIVR